LTDEQENESRLLINELNRAVFLENFSTINFTEQQIRKIL
jgi:hypothetical protein